MDFLANYGLFLLKSITLVVSILVVVIGIFAISKKPKNLYEVISLNEQYKKITVEMQKKIMGKKFKKPKHTKQEKEEQQNKPNLFVLSFDGDVHASQTENLRKAITMVLTVATEKDAVMLRLESPGGTVNGYGLAASQLKRIRDKNIPLTVCIDKVAASGGYLMACIANTIIAAPFAIIGSIGVVSQMPNIHRWLKKHDIDVELITAGEYKRTLTVLGENTEKGRQKFKQDLEQIHHAFREVVLANRSQLDIDKVATGEHWLGVDAFGLRLIDEIKTSDEFLLEKMNKYNIYKIQMEQKLSLVQRILKPAAKLLRAWG